MADSSLLTQPSAFPKPADPDRAAVGLEQWAEAAAATGRKDVIAAASEIVGAPMGRALLESVFGSSPFLSQCLLREVSFANRVIRNGPDLAFDAVMASVTAAETGPDHLDAVMSRLRAAKWRAALTIALADISGLWPLERVTGALSDFAVASLRITARHLLRAAADQGQFRLRHPDDPERDSGLIILAMGKLGPRELNYSSDVDLIVLYDEERVDTDDPGEVQPCFVRLARRLVRIMEDRTADGYVFRTDLRLRPDPGATPPALSTLAAETYYESAGQNWERAAFIKARAVAGDLGAGEEFLGRLKPFLWRRHLDFAAIQDIHSIKRQIHAHRGGGAIAVKGHNVKLGRGGIREIEFFAQTQQLIWGGRTPALRTAGTVESLRALAAAGHIKPTVAEELIAAYGFLRRVEHRLQMIEDQQTQTLPSGRKALAAFSTFLGYDDAADFAADLTAHLARVETHYARLFEEEPDLGTSAGNLVFTGADHDPGTLDNLDRIGFTESETVSTIIRAWHRGRYRATRSARARELLTELTPALMEALGRTADPTRAVLKFDEFLARLPAGVQLFSLFYANPSLLELVTEVIGDAPLLAEELSRKPLLLDAVLAGNFFAPLPRTDALEAELAAALDQALDFEDVLDVTRRWTGDRKFQAGVHILRNITDADASAPVLSDIAQVAIAALLPRVEDEFSQRHGRVPGAGLAVLGMGKLGSREITVASDLDLILIYDAPEGIDTSDGERPLAVSQYFARLSQRTLNAITAPTAEGRLYEVDMRLRPSGSAGPVASSLAAFTAYQRETAWTWEHMALTRARPIAGPHKLTAQIGSSIRDILVARREPDALLRDVADMRRRMEAEHGGESIWRAKHAPGALVDLEFMAQYLQLRHAHDHPEILQPAAVDVFGRAAQLRLLDPVIAGELVEATRLWHRVQGLVRLTLEGDFTAAPEGLQRAMVRVVGVEDFTAARAVIAETAARVRRHFEAMVLTPAAASGGESRGGTGGGDPAPPGVEGRTNAP